MLTGITLFRLVTAALLPVLVTVGFYQAEKKSRFGKISNVWKQTIIGVSFGVVAILATEFGIPVDGAVLNVRNAAPLTAGLVFGWPSGMIAGLVGGIERWFSHAGDYTRLACTIGTFVAGIFGAGVRKFMMDNKKASWFYGLAVGVTSEVLHMLLVFLTNAADIQRAFTVVKICAIPMIAANGASVMCSILAITFLVKRSGQHEHDSSRKENIAQTFQRWLLVCVILAFCATIFFTHAFQTKLAYAQVDYSLKASMEDVSRDIPVKGGMRLRIKYGPHDGPAAISARSASADDRRRPEEHTPIRLRFSRDFRLCAICFNAVAAVRTISKVITAIFINVSFLTQSRADKNTQIALTECSARAIFRHIFLFLKSIELF